MRRVITTVIATAMLGTVAAPAFAAYPVPFQKAQTVTTVAKDNGITIATSKKVVTTAIKPTTRTVLTEKPKPIVAPAVRRGQSIAPSVQGLTKNLDVVLKIVLNGKWVILGTANTGNNGAVNFPALSFKKPGTYKVYVVDPTTGNKVLIELRVR